MENTTITKRKTKASQPAIMCHSGEKCQKEGKWEALGPVSTTLFLAKDQITPFYFGKKVTWRLLEVG